MKALILNSGLGKRMGALTRDNPKCLTEIGSNETILGRQLDFLNCAGIKDVVITTGLFHNQIEEYCVSRQLSFNYEFVYNPLFESTNYIYSIALAEEFLHDDILLIHGDLVFEGKVLQDMLEWDKSCMAASSQLPLPKKDFKAVVNDGRITKVGIEFFDNACAAQPLYKLLKKDWEIWLDRIVRFCEGDQTSCYAEIALNRVTDRCNIYLYDFENLLCREIDTLEDLNIVRKLLKG